jgi:glycosyltransferase family protein
MTDGSLLDGARTYLSRLIWPTPQVRTVEDTLDAVVRGKLSLSRFGDGEIGLMNGGDILFQRGSSRLAKALRRVAREPLPGHISCVPPMFGKLDFLNASDREFWRIHLRRYEASWRRYFRGHSELGNAFLSRPYSPYERGQAPASTSFPLLRRLWAGRDVILVEGSRSMLGVGNDLLREARIAGRVIVPHRDAFEEIERIWEVLLELPGGHLYLVAAGPTATVLCYRLHGAGRQGIDIGHVDLEYEWWRRGADRKVKIPGRAVGEVPGDDIPFEGGTGEGLSLESYRQQVILTIEGGK